MSANPSDVAVCEKCGATIYPEMIDAGRAGKIEGKLECPHCYREDAQRSETASVETYDDTYDDSYDDTLDGPSAEPLAVPGLEEAPPVISHPKKDGPKVTYTGGGIAFQRSYDEGQFKRPLLTGSRNATRCRTFHAKLTDASLAHLDDLVNEWADSHEDIEIKFVTASMGVVEGKHADPHYILTCWY